MVKVIRFWLVLAFISLTTSCVLENNLFSVGAIAGFLAAGSLGVRRLRDGKLRGTGEMFGGLTWILLGTITLYLGCLLSWPFPVGPAISLAFVAVAMVLGVRKDLRQRREARSAS
ncbi:hypothetical protein FAF44_05745 [Nonomuraea sp. MG754425]|uniref:hypothetical protein n=1 Tax=Nonomuraea sp. MG754425 TaxID=2570319 RepID=UPI001F1C93ED|nr:hypothetical protein [Nonomuraea sp. MG754425]MCF6467907.1 hypothetical protein [Nonomuraea sp. MG754425]